MAEPDLTFEGPAAGRETIRRFLIEATKTAAKPVRHFAVGLDNTGERVTVGVEYDDGTRKSLQLLYADIAHGEVIPAGVL